MNIDTVSRELINDSNYMKNMLKLSLGKNISIVNNINFNKKLLDLPKSKFPYIMLNKLFRGNSGDLISAHSSKCPFYKKNKIKVSEFINYKLNYSFDEINNVVKEELFNINNSKIDITELSFKITSNIIGKVILDIEDNKIIKSLRNSFCNILKDLSTRPQVYLVPGILKIPTKKNKSINKDFKNIDTIFKKVISKKDSLGFEMSKYNSIEDILNFSKLLFFAGFETTSNQLSFIIYMLSKNQIWQDEIFKEIKKIDNIFSLENCKFLNSFIFETFRFHPIVNTSTREDRDTIYIFNTQKINSFQNDNSFNPYRYINSVPDILTFQSGLRQCIGKRISIIEIKLFVYYYISLFKTEIINNPQIKYSFTKYLSPNLITSVTPRLDKLCIYNIKKPIINFIDNIEVLYNGHKYNLSEYVFKHPGGKHILQTLNNNDITEDFTSKHINSKNALNILSKYKYYYPNNDIFYTYSILDIDYSELGNKFILLNIKYDKKCILNSLFKNGNTVVFHHLDGKYSKCFSISNINIQLFTFTLFIKKIENGIFSSNIDNIKNEFCFSFISSIYSNIKSGDLLISIGSGISPFISFINRCKIVSGFRGDYEYILEKNNIKNVILANSLKNEYVYNFLDKEDIQKNRNIYLCGHSSFINNILQKYDFKNIFFDSW